MGTKIQINSLQALERLIGGDSEVEVEIRNSVATEFTKKYLKGLLDREAQRVLTTTVLNEFSKEFTEKTKVGWREDVVLNKKAVEMIRLKVRDQIIDEIHNVVLDELDVQAIRASIKAKLEHTSKVIEKELSKEIVKGSLEKLVRERIEKMSKSIR